MIDITQKSNTLRKAIATATVKVSKQETMDAINNNKVPKGNLFEFARVAGLFAIKKTSDVIPDCHPLPIEYAAINYEVNELNILISVEVHTIYKTGVEVEAMHGASIVALTMYDMLKPIDKGIEISRIKLESKKGGKSDFNNALLKELKCAVIVCSDSIFAGKAEDRAGKAIIHKLEACKLKANVYEIIPDEFTLIQDKAKQLSAEKYDLVLFTGGTGLSPRDVTPEAILPLLDREIPGMMEMARNYGQQRTPYSMLSRGIAGFMKNTLVLTLPGSTKGAAETMDALFPSVLHVFAVAEGMKHG
ncbi:MAG: bifunctional molybdenum cofactor biosynthesis protein MoaC/MoaB [Bacteroidota bacterium]|nr:bifunctional molybdenum cofactor biosynthesis protein MoaC/MoaB [Bacteroidota bacterium]